MDETDSDEVMSLGEVAAYLRLGERTVLKMAQRGDIPAAKVASQWRFLRSLVRDWLAGQMQAMPVEELRGRVGPTGGPLRLGDVVRADLIKLDMKPGTKNRVLSQLVEPARASGFASDPERLLASLVERERMMTTAIGHGIAIPHPRRAIPGMFPEPAVVVGLCREGTPFDAVDDALVHLFFLICATRDAIHLQLMAKLSWLVRDERVARNLRRAESPAQVLSEISKATAAIDGRASHK